MIVRRKSDELYHHGVEGQSWGKRHGPPYPLDSNSSKQAARKRKAAAKAARKQSKRDKKKNEQEKKIKQKIKKAVHEGDLATINKYKSHMSNDELKEAISRLDLMVKVSSLKSEDKKKQMQEARAYIGTVKDVVGVVNEASKFTSNFDDVLNKASKGKEKKD